MKGWAVERPDTGRVRVSLVCDVSSCWTIRECGCLADYSMTLGI